MPEADDRAEADRLRYEMEELIARGRALASERDSQNDSMQIDFQEFTLGVGETSSVGKAVLAARPLDIDQLEALESEVEAGKVDGPLSEIFVKSETCKVVL